MKRTALVTAVFLAAASLAAAAEEEFHWQGRVAQGAAIEIKGVNGPIVATGGSGGEVELTAIKKGTKDDPARVKIAVVEHPGGVTVCAVYPSEGETPNACAPGRGGRMQTKHGKHNDVRVEFQVKVPAGVRFVGRTVNGAISASGITADAEAETVNGKVGLEATGTARAHTVNGAISASLGRADWQGTLQMNTVNGAIEVTLPAAANAEVKASTVHGAIESDFPLSGSSRPAHRSLSGTIGSGGRLLEMSTVNGASSIRKAGAARG